MSVDMYPDAAREYIIHHSDPQSTPEATYKMFVLVPRGPIFEVYGYESDIAEHAELNKDAIYFWADGDAEDFAPELTMEEVWELTKTVAVAINGATTAENSGANPPSLAVGVPSGAGVETADEGKFVVDGVRPWRPLEVLRDPQ